LASGPACPIFHAPMLTAFTLENYRCFADPTTIELRPLTLLFGYNNSGKSALLRALALIAVSSRPDAGSPLVLKSEAARDCMFDELRSRLGGSDTIKIGLSFEGGGLTAEYAITREPGGIRQVITEMRVTQGDTKIALEWSPGPGRATSYLLRWNGEPTKIAMKRGFTGLVPDGLSVLSGDEPPGAADALYRLAWLFDVQKLHAEIGTHISERWLLKDEQADEARRIAESILELDPIRKGGPARPH